jgi:glycosyltransferase involved in cell wall biosynthesis
MEDRIKILMTADTVGGVWTYAINLCKGLQDYNTEIHLMTMGGSLDKSQVRQISQLRNIFLYCSDYKLEWMDNPWEDVKLAGQWISSVYKKVKPDIVHFNNYGELCGEWMCPVVTVFHSCVQTWWKAVKTSKIPAEWEKYCFIVEKALFFSDVLVAPSAAMLAEAEKVYGRIGFSKVIYNGSDDGGYVTEAKEPFILSAGRVWDEAKNIAMLSEVAARLKWPVYIAGNHESPFTGTAAIPENVHFLGQLSQEELQYYMDRASIFVMPAKYEPFGLAILEAAKSGCALVLGNISSLNEIWEDTAMYFDPDDKEQAVNVINRLIKDDRLRAEISSKSSGRAKEFTIEKMASEYMELYKGLLVEKHLKKRNKISV